MTEVRERTEVGLQQIERIRERESVLPQLILCAISDEEFEHPNRHGALYDTPSL
ncbi:MAG: hypothetical protein WD557_18220 [Dehalococcoidia bacterium]